MALSQLELAARVAAGVFVIVAPTLLFLLLWRGLESMRDDELIARARERAEAMEEADGDGAWDVDAAALRATVTGGDPVPADAVACSNCGTHNRTGVTYCQQCLAELD
ncbi:DUF7577 domain-containing protein [Haloarcula litorea]|uniref:DUF7577 domain-containing protein n=1 Tax=Haloarcula litorea TaxID=3032579 RepID=UPI0023E8C35F|nr:zinc-ribbon domain-containing protein [Halomicroarcula sp. GDY20]